MKMRHTVLFLSPFLIMALLAINNSRLLFAVSPKTADPIEITSAVDPDTVNPSGIIPGQMVRFFLTVKNVTDATYQNVNAHAEVPNFTTFNARESDERWTLLENSRKGRAAEAAQSHPLVVCPDGANPGTNCVLSLGSLGAGEEVTISYAMDLDSFLPPDFTSLNFTYGATWDPNIEVTILPPTIIVVPATVTSVTQVTPAPTSTAIVVPTPAPTPIPEVRAFLPLMLR